MDGHYSIDYRHVIMMIIILMVINMMIILSTRPRNFQPLETKRILKASYDEVFVTRIVLCTKTNAGKRKPLQHKILTIAIVGCEFCRSL